MCMLEITVKGEGFVKTLHESLWYSLSWIDERHGNELLMKKIREPHRKRYFCVTSESSCALDCCHTSVDAFCIEVARRHWL